MKDLTLLVDICLITVSLRAAQKLGGVGLMGDPSLVALVNLPHFVRPAGSLWLAPLALAAAAICGYSCFSNTFTFLGSAHRPS
jgi:hypothetical protein